jgi:hypothetical protein
VTVAAVPVLVFGSRPGTWIALLLVAAILGAVAAVALRTLGPAKDRKRRLRSRSWAAIGVAVPLVLVYVAAFRGFHEIVLGEAGHLHLRYLLPFEHVELFETEITSARPEPWYRGQWRLAITTVSGRTYASAPTARPVVQAAADSLAARRRSG